MADSILCCIYILTLRQLKSHWWYDTVFSYPAGMAVALIWQKHHSMTNWLYVVFHGSVLFTLLLCWKFRQTIWVYEFLAVFFVLEILLITMKIKPGNAVLSFVGKYTFEIYILQRIPMMVFTEIMPTGGFWKAPFFLLSFIFTIALAIAFQKYTGFLDEKLESIIHRRNYS